MRRAYEGYRPGWEEYIRREEEVEVYAYDGSDEASADLMRAFPENFAIRSTESNGKRITRLCLQDDVTSVAVIKPNVYIIRDSCGHFYLYEPEFFELEFKSVSEGDNARAEELAQAYYEAERKAPVAGSFLGEYSTDGAKWEDLPRRDRSQRIMAMANLLKEYAVVRR